MTSKQAEQANTSDQGSWSGRTSPEHSPVTKEKISERSCKSSSKSQSRQPLCLLFRREVGHTQTVIAETDGRLRTELSMLNTGECPNVVVESTLSQILEDNVPKKYYLTAKACSGILRRAEKRGKALPKILRIALEQQIARSA